MTQPKKRTLLPETRRTRSQCIDAWRKLSREFFVSDLMCAIYGGVALGHIDFGYDLWSPKKHFTDVVCLGNDPGPLSADNNGRMTQQVRIPFDDIRRLLALHSFSQQELDEHDYKADEVNALYLTIQIGLVDPEETGFVYGTNEPLPT